MSVFNEYMTHALFCLYIRDTYDKPTADLVIERRESLMVDTRNFSMFREFNQELLKQHKENPNLKAIELYEPVLKWCQEKSGWKRHRSN